jgi:hypothetical protein
MSADKPRRFRWRAAAKAAHTPANPLPMTTRLRVDVVLMPLSRPTRAKGYARTKAPAL